MYASLDLVDLVFATEQEGQRHFLQTDHRSRVEIEQELELSALFALIRTLNPQRMTEAGQPEPLVSFLVTEPLPEVIQALIEAAGGAVYPVDAFMPDQLGPAPTVSDILAEHIQRCMERLAQATVAKHQIPFSVVGLAALEAALPLHDKEEAGETAYWTAVLELGTLAGEIIRQQLGHQWVVSENGTLPLALVTSFRGQPAVVNPLGKAVKRFAEGADESLVDLVQMLTHNGLAAGLKETMLNQPS